MLSSREATQTVGPERLDVERIRSDFPILSRKVHGHPLVYLDNAASSQMPRQVIERMARYQHEEHANVHRGVHLLSETATAAYEGVREKLRAFLNARSTREIIFVRGATEGINLVMHSYGRKFLNAGDEIVISAMEHHANIVPWQMLCEEKGCKLRVIPITDQGELRMDQYRELFNERTRFVAVSHVSNALGTINPVAELIEVAHAHGVPILLDGAQAAPHLTVDVQALGCDFYVFSGHKMCGPTGSGALYGREELLEKMQPFMGGGDMIRTVTFEKTTYNELPYKFEAGTPAIAPIVGLGAAIDYLSELGLPRIAAYEHELLEVATDCISRLAGVRIVGTAPHKVAVVSMVLDGIHPHDVGTLLDEEGIAVRAGHHCAQPLMERLGVTATVRASFAFYNTFAEIDALVAGLVEVRKVFGS